GASAASYAHRRQSGKSLESAPGEEPTMMMTAVDPSRVSQVFAAGRSWYPAPMPSTHEVLNQPPPLEHYDLFSTDRALVEALEREGAGWARERAHRVGAEAGGEAPAWGRLAHINPPGLRTQHRLRHRIGR